MFAFLIATVTKSARPHIASRSSPKTFSPPRNADPVHRPVNSPRRFQQLLDHPHVAARVLLSIIAGRKLWRAILTNTRSEMVDLAGEMRKLMRRFDPHSFGFTSMCDDYLTAISRRQPRIWNHQ